MIHVSKVILALLELNEKKYMDISNGTTFSPLHLTRSEPLMTYDNLDLKLLAHHHANLLITTVMLSINQAVHYVCDLDLLCI